MLFSGSWSAAVFFRQLTQNNLLARYHDFAFAEVSGLQGFLDAISQASESPNVIAVDDTSDGYIEVSNSPGTHAVKTVYLAMRHSPGDMDARAECLTIMREIFRQFMSVFIRERTQLEQSMIYIDSKVSFSEMDRYFCTGQACAFFQIAVSSDTDLRYNPEQWTQKTETP